LHARRKENVIENTMGRSGSANNMVGNPQQVEQRELHFTTDERRNEIAFSCSNINSSDAFPLPASVIPPLCLLACKHACTPHMVQ